MSWRLYTGRGLSTGIAILIIVIVALAAFAGILGYGSEVATTRTPAWVPPSTSTKSNASPLILYSADAYVAESSALESAFTNRTGIQTVPPKAGGSLLLGQQIAQGDPVSVFLSVSRSAVSSAVLKDEFPGWAVAFATDEMALAYSNASARISYGAVSSVIDSYQAARASNTTGAWFAFFSNLTSGKVKVGISNPNADPAGFRAWLVLQAAGALYAGNDSSYFVNRMLQNNGNVSAASAADLVAPLQAGQIQFVFIYRSAVIAQHLGLILLNDGINLGDPSHDAFYATFAYATSSGLERGGTILLYLSVPNDSTNYEGALEFVTFVARSGAQTLSQFGLSTLAPARLYNDTPTSVPPALTQLAAQGELEYSGAL